MTLERIDIGHGIALGAGLREAALLAAFAGKARPLVHNGVYRSYVLPPIRLSARTFRPSVYFTDGLLASTGLTWVDPEIEGGDAWESFSFEREQSIAEEDAAWLSSYLRNVGSATSPYWFDWGTVWSGFDPRSGFSSIVIRYGHL